MSLASFLQLVSLGAIWGSSFHFLSRIVPTLGPFVTANARCFIAGIVLTIYLIGTQGTFDWKKNYRHYLVSGILQFALPFSLFAIGSKTLPPAYPSIMNATSPLFGAILSWLFLDEKLHFKKLIGLLISISGVVIVVRLGYSKLSIEFVLRILACLIGALCYALAGLYVKKYASKVNPVSLTSGGTLCASVLLLPISFATLPSTFPTLKIVLYVLALSILCTAIAFLVYYRLIVLVGTTKAFANAFLIPVFAIIWGAIFKNTLVPLSAIIGTLMILVGVFLVVYTKAKAPQVKK